MDETAEETATRRSSRRRESNQRQTTKTALELLKEARRTGKTHRQDVSDSVKNVYDLVDDDEFNNITRTRQEDDFVVDDDGMGYVDHGVDFEEEIDDCGTKKKKEKKDEKRKRGPLQNYFPLVTRAKAKNENEVRLEEDDALSAVLAEIGNIDEASTSEARNPFRVEREATVIAPSERILPRPIKRSSLMPSRPASSADSSFLCGSKAQLDSALPPPAKIRAQPRQPLREPSVEQNYSDVPECSSEFVEERPSISTPAEKEEIPIADECDSLSSLTDISMEFASADSQEIAVSSEPGSELFYREVNGKRSIRMFWMDAFEDEKRNPGTVYLFGRVLLSEKESASCCVILKNIQRQIFVLPRRNTDGTVCPFVDVHSEIKQILKHEFRCKPSSRGVVGVADIEPGELTHLLEVQYDSRFPALPTTTSGRMFSRVFNTTTTSLERVLIEFGLKGPGWIDVSRYEAGDAKVSTCRFEFSVDMAGDLCGRAEKNAIFVDSSCLTAPPSARLLSLHVVSALNDKKENEIVMISCLLTKRSSVSELSLQAADYHRFCFLCRPTKSTIPFDFQKHLQTNKLADSVQILSGEKGLLTCFLGKIGSEDFDPDFIVGHDLSATMTLLMERAEKLKVVNWSRFGRLKRRIELRRLGHGKSAQHDFSAGRMLLDSRILSMELVRARNYDLPELASSLLQTIYEPTLPHTLAKHFEKSPSLLEVVRKGWVEGCLLPLRVVAQLNALPLAISITNIVGGILSRTLLGGRAERNELLLLHAFHKAGILAPDKYQHSFKKDETTRQKKQTEEKGKDENEEDRPAPSGNKAQYSGGLVLEPRAGLYETLVLLLDFNSLYPSIIQEYNICFTTIPHEKDGGEVPQPPSSEIAKGILPKQIEVLVTSRSEVKKLLKSERDPQKKKQYDIRQKALKLTANSMYGCLGFVQSRFYAKPLAALITAKGREILLETKEVVEKDGLEVIYGDTDSIMVNTNDNEMAKASLIAREITKKINKRRNKLELEHEGTFRRMLLLKKKKYAALVVDAASGKESQELKGLDIVRRDWAQIAKDIGSEIVEYILDVNRSREDLLSEIEKSLTSYRKEIEEGIIPLEKFVISKQLTRPPSSYTDKAQAHASVAKRVTESGKMHFKQGDVVEYVICEDESGLPAMQRAYHRLEIEENKELKIDVNYYLAQQIHPVVSRLCAPLEEMDTVRLAEILGLDSSGYRRAAAATVANNFDEAYEWAESLENCDAFVLKCPGCGTDIQIKSVFEGQDSSLCRPSLSECGKCSLHLAEKTPFVVNSLRAQLDSFVSRHATASYVCDDSTCAFKMRSLPMKTSTSTGVDCPKCGSVGTVRKEYTSKQLYEQQTFFCGLFSLAQAVASLPSKEQQEVCRTPNYTNTCALSETLRLLCRQYLDSNQYNLVKLPFLFAPMMRD